MREREIHGHMFKKEGKHLYLSSIAQNIKDIKETLKNYWDIHNDEFISRINNATNNIIKDFDVLKKLHNNDPKKLIPIMIHFLNNMLDTFWLKKFYNLTPSINYEEYNNMWIGEQIINNTFDGKIYPDKPCIIKKKYIRWGNCHHRSITIKNIIEQLHIPWVECRIAKVPEWHSFVIIEYGGQIYMSDILEYNTILDAKDMNREWWILAYKVLNPEFSDLREFTDVKKFIKIAENIKYNSIKLQIDRIKIEIEGDTIKIEIKHNKSTTKKSFHIQRDKEKKKYTKKALIEMMFPRITELLPIISKKIKKEHLTDIV